MARRENHLLPVKLIRKTLRDRLPESLSRRKLIEFSKERYQKAKIQSTEWVSEGRQRIEKRRTAIRNHRQIYHRRIRESFTQRRRRLQNYWNSVKTDLFTTRWVTLTEYFEKEWFDDAGRPLTSRDATGRFVNPWQSQSTSGVKTATAILMWRWERLLREFKEYGFLGLVTSSFHKKNLPRDDVPVIDAEVRPALKSRVGTDEIKVTWIGHSTCLVQQGDVTILTDPMFSTRASPYEKFVGVARDIPTAYTIEEMPPVDLVLISHDHYDHLDKQSVIKLASKVKHWVVPLGLKKWLQLKCGIEPLVISELEWWESVEMERNSFGDWKPRQHHLLQRTTDDKRHPALTIPRGSHSSRIWVTCTPVQHWAGRTFWDRNFRLWCSFCVYFPNKQTFFFAGDTALPAKFPLFRMIRDYIGPVDVAALPIGAYQPDFMNEDDHTNPSEALKVHKILQPRQSLGIHWGAFCLSEEPLSEPPQLLKKYVDESETRDEGPIHFTTIPVGESLSISRLKEIE